MEQEGLHKFKKELLDVRLDGGENSAQGTADAKYGPVSPNRKASCCSCWYFQGISVAQSHRTPGMNGSCRPSVLIRQTFVRKTIGPWMLATHQHIS